MKPFLLLAIRAEDAAADNEYDSFLTLSGLGEGEHARRIGMQLRTDGRVNSVGADQRIAGDRHLSAVGAAEMARHSLRILFKAFASVAEHDSRAAFAPQYGCQQHTVQLAAMDRELRP